MDRRSTQQLSGNFALMVAAILALGLSMGLSALTSTASARPINHNNFPPLRDVMLEELYRTNLVGNSDDGLLGVGDYQSLLPLIPPAKNLGTAWEIYATEWSLADEAGYENFVRALGRSGCISIDDCLRSKANPYRDLEDEDLWMGDCTDMVYVLRGYYAWKNGLPFSFEDSITAVNPKERSSDLRYTSDGNRVTSRYNILHAEGRAPRNAPKLLRRIFNIVSTAMLRTDPELQGAAASSFYPVRIDRQAVRPGIAAYDVYGHVSIVYDVTDTGRVLLISSHPDFTVSREPFGRSIIRTKAALGSGLKAWRPIKLIGARKTAKGTYVGGSIVLMRNEQISDFSMEQFHGAQPDASGDWSKGRFEIDGRNLPFYDYVRVKLRKPGVPFEPLEEMSNAMNALCSSIRTRRAAVNLALYAKVDKAPHPDKLPPNIYGTYGDWERFATPSRDARLKTQAVELRAMVQSLIMRSESNDPSLAYVSHDLAAALLDVYNRRATACKITYKRSDGTKMRLNLDNILDRLFDLSFDPFHCPERRWGATGWELETCTDDSDKHRWYEAQRYLRNAASRTYDLRTDFPADALQDPAKATPENGGIGLSRAPDVDIHGYLMFQAGDHETANTALPIAILEASDAIN